MTPIKESLIVAAGITLLILIIDLTGSMFNYFWAYIVVFALAFGIWYLWKAKLLPLLQKHGVFGSRKD